MILVAIDILFYSINTFLLLMRCICAILIIVMLLYLITNNAIQNEFFLNIIMFNHIVHISLLFVLVVTDITNESLIGSLINLYLCWSLKHVCFTVLYRHS